MYTFENSNKIEFYVYVKKVGNSKEHWNLKYNKDGEGLAYLRSKFPGISDAKIKEGVFIVPQMRDLIHDVNFD